MNKLTIDGDISYWGYSARWLFKKLENMSGEVEVDISTYGGDVYEGIDMFNQLRNYSKTKGHVTTVGGSKVMSIGSLLLLAGDTRKAHTNSTIMIHRAWTWLAGNADEMIAESKILGGIDVILAKQYNKHMDSSQEEILEIMSKEGWYIGQEQIQTTNFIDVFIDEDVEVEVSPQTSYAKAMARFSAKAKEENIKPNLASAKASILQCNDGKCPSSEANPTASASENLISDDSKKNNTGADMEFNFDVDDLSGTEKQFDALVANKITMDNRDSTTQVELQTANAALEAKTKEHVALVASSKVAATEAEEKLASFKTETEARIGEAVASGVSTKVALTMVQASSKEDSTKLALEAKESDGGSHQTDEVNAKDDDGLMAYALKNEGKIK